MLRTVALAVALIGAVGCEDPDASREVPVLKSKMDPNFVKPDAPGAVTKTPKAIATH